MYPDSNIWVIGHSLGGALASLLGVTFGAPVVAFESPGEKMASTRLHLPSPVRSSSLHSTTITERVWSSKPSTQHITHVYHNADPIAMGTCNGVLSSCAIGGYAMESQCVPSFCLHLQLLIIDSEPLRPLLRGFPCGARPATMCPPIDATSAK